MVFRVSEEGHHIREIMLGKEVCTFSSKQKWIQKASSWMGGYLEKEIICLDATGKICGVGRDFDNATYPVTVYLRYLSDMGTSSEVEMV